MRLQTIPSDSVDVLIVEDDSLLRAALRLLQERGGYRCAEARDGRQALAVAREQPPRCVLLDLVLPGLDGFAVARRLRADPRTFGTHIHCLAEFQHQQVREYAQRVGFEEFLTKNARSYAQTHPYKTVSELKLGVFNRLQPPGTVSHRTGRPLFRKR